MWPAYLQEGTVILRNKLKEQLKWGKRQATSCWRPFSIRFSTKDIHIYNITLTKMQNKHTPRHLFPVVKKSLFSIYPFFKKRASFILKENAGQLL